MGYNIWAYSLASWLFSFVPVFDIVVSTCIIMFIFHYRGKQNGIFGVFKKFGLGKICLRL